MLTALFIILGGLLVRADGWGPENDAVAATWPTWKLRASKFFNAWSCSAIFAVLGFLYAGNIAGLAAGPAFLAFRLPGFSSWQSWGAMFLRGAWTTFIGFVLLSYAVHGHPFYGWLFIPMGVAEMLAYCVPYNYLIGRLPDWVIHPTAEISSGAAFTAFVCVIIAGV